MTRREREAAAKANLGKLTSPERAGIRRWVRKRVSAEDVNTAIAELEEWTAINGWDRFVAERALDKPAWERRLGTRKAIWQPRTWKPA
jgi:hypothetical protein